MIKNKNIIFLLSICAIFSLNPTKIYSEEIEHFIPHSIGFEEKAYLDMLKVLGKEGDYYKTNYINKIDPKTGKEKRFINTSDIVAIHNDKKGIHEYNPGSPYGKQVDAISYISKAELVDKDGEIKDIPWTYCTNNKIVYFGKNNSANNLIFTSVNNFDELIKEKTGDLIAGKYISKSIFGINNQDSINNDQVEEEIKKGVKEYKKFVLNKPKKEKLEFIKNKLNGSYDLEKEIKNLPIKYENEEKKLEKEYLEVKNDIELMGGTWTWSNVNSLEDADKIYIAKKNGLNENKKLEEENLKEKFEELKSSKEYTIKDNKLYKTVDDKEWEVKTDNFRLVTQKILDKTKVIQVGKSKVFGRKVIERVLGEVYVYDKFLDTNKNGDMKILVSPKKDYYFGEYVDYTSDEYKKITVGTTDYVTIKDNIKKYDYDPLKLKKIIEDKKSLSPEDFKEKYKIKPEETEKIKNTLALIKEKEEIITGFEKQKQEATRKLKDKYIANSPENNKEQIEELSASGLIKNTWGSKKGYYKVHYLANSKFRDFYQELAEIYNGFVDEEKKLDNKYPNKYAPELVNIIPKKDLSTKKVGKYVELVGKGRVDGEIDLGEGYNILDISEKLTGYSTNIVLGKNASIKNVDTLIIGYNNNNSVGKGIVGEYSLILEVDKKFKNKENQLNQHAFKDLDPNIRFEDEGEHNDNENSITETKRIVGLDVSNLDKDEIIDMGRALEYKYIRRGKKEEGTHILDVKSDSIAHIASLIKKDATQEKIDDNEADYNTHKITVKNKAGHSLAQVKVKDNLSVDVVKYRGYIDGKEKFKKVANENDNNFYKSMKNAGQISALADTFKMNNKIVNNSITREEEAFNQFIKIANDYNKNNIYTKINYIDKENLSEFANTPYKTLKLREDFKTPTTFSLNSNKIVKDDIRGLSTLAIGTYEKENNNNLKKGFIIGGINNDFKEVNIGSSSLKSNGAYLGGYLDKTLNPNFRFITGAGLEYNIYNIKRTAKNDYNSFDFNSKGNTRLVNMYLDLIYTKKLKKDMKLHLRGEVEYQHMRQSAFNEKENTLAMDVKKQKYDRVRTEVDLSLSKNLSDDKGDRNLKGEIGIEHDISNKNKTLKANIKNSTPFVIDSRNASSTSAKLSIRYDVQTPKGLTYGLEGTYKTNSKEDGINMGFKAGYKF